MYIITRDIGPCILIHDLRGITMDGYLYGKYMSHVTVDRSYKGQNC